MQQVAASSWVPPAIHVSVPGVPTGDPEVTLRRGNSRPSARAPRVAPPCMRGHAFRSGKALLPWVIECEWRRGVTPTALPYARPGYLS